MTSPSVNVLARVAEHPFEGAELVPQRALDPYSGTGSVRRVLLRHWFEVVSLDIDPSSHADITCDILDWDRVSKRFFPNYYGNSPLHGIQHSKVDL